MEMIKTLKSDLRKINTSKAGIPKAVSTKAIYLKGTDKKDFAK